MTVNKDMLGWYYINEMWNLHVDGGFETTYVSWICVDQPPNGIESDYHVDHYGRGGDLITSLRLEKDDIEPVLRDRETENRPSHI